MLLLVQVESQESVGKQRSSLSCFLVGGWKNDCIMLGILEFATET